MSRKTVVIVPTYNEKDNLPSLAQRVMGLAVPVEMLVVDDRSPDGTGELADELARQNPRLHVLHRAEKDGLGRAYCAGFHWALERDYEFIFEMDGDFSHHPDDIPAFLQAAQAADLVLGSRYRYGFQIELTHKLWRQGMRIVEVPIIFTDRFQGTSKMSRKIVLEALLMVWRLLLQNRFRRSPRKRS